MRVWLARDGKADSVRTVVYSEYQDLPFPLSLARCVPRSRYTIKSSSQDHYQNGSRLSTIISRTRCATGPRRGGGGH